MTEFIQIHPNDSVAVALKHVTKGTVFMDVCAAENIHQGHKMALRPISAGEDIVKYGCVIGHATENIAVGQWVHTHNMATNLSGGEAYTYSHEAGVCAGKTDRTFFGFFRPNGKVGIRNEIWILPLVGCVNDVAKALARENQDLVQGSIDGLYAYTHPFGCSQTGDDHAQTRKLLAALAKHPNAAAVLILGLGCENLTVEQFKMELGEHEADKFRFLICQQVEDEMEAGRALLRECAAYAENFQRQIMPASELVVGMKCGGSDGLSGITANPVVGKFSDLLIRNGGSTVLTEVPEMFGAESILLNRCADQTVFDRAVDMLNRFKQYYIDHGEQIYENPSPGNRAGGVTTLEDKSCGCIQKGGHGVVTDVIGYGEQVTKKGLTLLSGPGNDLVSATALTAAGAHLVLFTTGRGTPFGAPAPTMKIASNTTLAEKKSGWIDFNAGVIADGTRSIPEAAEDLLDLVLDTASGKQTCSERRGYREIAIFKDGVVL